MQSAAERAGLKSRPTIRRSAFGPGAVLEIKIFNGIIERGAMETAFLDRIARDSRRAPQ